MLLQNFVDQSATWQSRPFAAPNHFDALFFFPFECLKASNTFSNSYATLFFLFAICDIFQQSIAFLRYLLQFKAIGGHVVNSLRYLFRFCNSLQYLLRFMAILQLFQVFLTIFFGGGQFTAFFLVTWGLFFKEYFTKRSKIHDYPTRHVNDLNAKWSYSVWYQNRPIAERRANKT